MGYLRVFVYFAKNVRSFFAFVVRPGIVRLKTVNCIVKSVHTLNVGAVKGVVWQSAVVARIKSAISKTVLFTQNVAAVNFAVAVRFAMMGIVTAVGIV